MGSTLYHTFRGNKTYGDGYPPNSLYLVDPTGWTVQITARWADDIDWFPDSSVDDGGFGGYCYDFCVSDF